MNLRATLSIGLFLIILIGTSCSNQRLASSESDGVYYSSEDRFKPENEEFNRVTEVSGEDYQSSDAPSSNYYSIGKEESLGQNPNSEAAYAASIENSQGNAATETGATVNNFYGNTTYSEGDYYEDDYASRLRRFDNYGLSQNYGYYDPFFVDPFWNYGWSAWNPYPAGGWNIGYSTYGGWRVGYNWGWGNIGYGRPWYNQPLWYRHAGNLAYWDYWSYGYGWGGYGWGGYGWGGYGPYGCYPSPFYNGPYYGGAFGNGYWNGYQNGFSDGYFTGNQDNRRPSYNGRRSIAGNDGFSDNVNQDSRRNDAMNTRVDQVSNAGAPRANTLTASNETISEVSSNKRLTGIEAVYQSDIKNNKSRPNAVSKEASSTYGVKDRANASVKYATGASVQNATIQKNRVASGPQNARTSASANGQTKQRVGSTGYRSAGASRSSAATRSEVRTSAGSRYQSTNRSGAVRSSSNGARTSRPQSYRNGAASGQSRATSPRSSGRSGTQTQRSGGTQRSSGNYNRSGSSSQRMSTGGSSTRARSNASSRPSSSARSSSAPRQRSGSYSGGSSRSGASSSSRSGGGSNRSGASSSRSSGGRR